MSASIQGMNMLGIKDAVTADHLNAVRGALLNSVELDDFKATNQDASSPASQVRLTCGRARLWDPSGGTPALARKVNLTVELTATGLNGLDHGSVTADTFYYLWFIGKCAAGDARATDLAGLASLSASAPTLPSGYTHRLLAGVCRTGTGGVLKGFVQRDATWLYAERQLAVHLTATVARTTHNLASFMPPESKIALIKLRSHAPGTISEADAYMWTKGSEGRLATFDADYAEESQTTSWIPAPTREFDYKWILQAGSGSLDIWCLGFRWPINREP